jgi:HEPN domain-containing protein
MENYCIKERMYNMYEEYLGKTLSEIIIAKQALNNYKVTNIKDMKNTASYHTQQAIELLMKYKIYNDIRYNNGETEIKQLFTHDLDKLILHYCIPFGIYVPEKIMKNADKYSSWEAESRYSLGHSVRTDVIISALNEVEQWLIQTKPMYKAKIASVNKKLGL